MMEGGGRIHPREHPDDHMTRLLHRVQGEFLEMPGLRLAPAQAARLLAIELSLSERILNGLVDDGFLYRTRDGAHLRVTVY
jgi:hypothetical protein